MRCNGNAFMKGLECPKPPAWTGKDSIWTLLLVGSSQWWAIRTPSSNHPRLEPGCTLGNTQEPTPLAVCCIPAAWHETDTISPRADAASDWDLPEEYALCWFLSGKLSLSMWTCMGLYRLIRRSPLINLALWKAKHVWVTSFGDASLLRTQCTTSMCR